MHATTPPPTRYLAPDFVTRRILNPLLSALTRLGVSVRGSRILTVRGRTSGVPRSTIVNLLTVEGVRYLVAPRGTTQWVRNLRAADGAGTLRLGRRVEPFTATELDDAGKPAIIRAYLVAWAWEVGRFFDGLTADSPDSGDRRRSRRLPGVPHRLTRPSECLVRGPPARNTPLRRNTRMVGGAGCVRHRGRHVRRRARPRHHGHDRRDADPAVQRPRRLGGVLEPPRVRPRRGRRVRRLPHPRRRSRRVGAPHPGRPRLGRGGPQPVRRVRLHREVEAVAARVRDDIIERSKRPEHKAWGMYEFAVSDPDGVLVRVGWPSGSLD